MEKKVEFKSGKNILRGKLFVPKGKGPFPAIIFFHGNGGRGEKYFEFSSKLVKKGIISFAFNFAGCGISDGKYSLQTQKNALGDGINAFNFLFNQKGVDKQRISVLGGSFGGFIAASILPKINLKTLILLSPSAHNDLLTTKLDIGPLKEEIKYFKNKKNWFGSKAYQNISKFKNPLLIIKSENDENVPEIVVDRYFSTAKNTSSKKMETLKGADHRLSTTRMKNDAYAIISAWLKKTL